MSNLSRRKFIITTGATAAGTLLFHGCSSGSSDTASTGGATSPNATPATTTGTGDTPEVDSITLGFIALTDCAPLIIAKEKGFFEKYGMKNAEVKKQTSWATTRDNLELGGEKGGIDGAHILSPMPYLMTAGKITKSPVPMYLLARLNLDGQGISLSNEYLDLKLGAKAETLKAKVDAKKASGKKFQCAVTFPGGTHDLWMRYWLAANGIDPEKDVDIKVIPPPQMVANMETKAMDAFCVGEPWNQRLVTKKLGYNAVTTGELWKGHPEKAFTLRADWVDKHPKAAKALLMAVQEAQIWCDTDANKVEMCEILSADKYVKAPAKDIIERAKGNFNFGDGRTLANSPLLMKFWRENASFPFKSHDTWFVTEDMRWGKMEANTDVKKLVDQVNRSDLWREAAKAIGQEAAIPKEDSRGVETFFDGVKFDPANATAYLDSLKIKKA
jgi:nitrate/nitrite transport system substrate-binding protein